MIKRFIVLGLIFSPLISFSQSEIKSIDDIYAQTVVGVPPSDAYIGLSRMDDGEIRHYNYGEQRETERSIYFSSRDNGLTWQTKSVASDMPYADIKSPISGEYIRAFHTNSKVYIIRTEGGIDGDRTIREIDDKLAIMLKPPIFVNGGKTAIIAAHRTDRTGCFVYISEDDGLSWKRSNTINSPAHQKGGEHKGVRWNHGAVEPTVAELPDGRLWMIMRTARDHHYQSFSEDGGYSWSTPEPSPFYGTITMPTFHKLNDGRLLFFWSNTTPLPEMESATGAWDDVFTNRSASHVAISEDGGKTWIGMRELILDHRRGAADFASAEGIDKSVHQAQAVELEGGKVLVSAGQSKLHRKMLIFDIDWLYEKSRQSSFEDNGNDWSMFRYYKGIVGHCGYNRQSGNELLIDHPDRKDAKVLKIGYTPNETLVEDRDGALWNFPAAKDGEISLRLKINESSEAINLILNDRWFNPTDTVALTKSQYCIEISRKSLKIRDDNWHDVTIRWNYNGDATMFVDDRKVGKYRLQNSTIHGVSYLHLLSGNKRDSSGVLIESVNSLIK